MLSGLTGAVFVTRQNATVCRNTKNHRNDGRAAQGLASVPYIIRPIRQPSGHLSEMIESLGEIYLNTSEMAICLFI